MTKIITISVIVMLLSSPILAFAQNNDINHKLVFDITKTNVTTNLASHGSIPFHFEFDRSFSEPNDTYYELFKVIDSRNNQHVGDLRIYVGSSQWWNENAFLQEDDTTEYENIIKIKLFVTHLTDPDKIEDVSNSLSNVLQVLVPEWSNETTNVSSNDWFFDSINNSKRNEENKRENQIIVSDKTIRIFHDDMGFGSMTLIVTENLDITSKDYVLEEKEILDTMEPEPKDNESTQSGGGCLIATATYGTELAPQIQQLREIRENMLETQSGSSFISAFNDLYYSFSPMIADYERENPVFKQVVKVGITPMIESLSILNYVGMDSEEEVLGYGISLIVLNIGMYVGLPLIVVAKFARRG